MRKKQTSKLILYYVYNTNKYMYEANRCYSQYTTYMKPLWVYHTNKD